MEFYEQHQNFVSSKQLVNAKHIFEKFLSDGATVSLNVTRAAIEKAQSMINQPKLDMFKDVIKEVKSNLSDTLNRFRYTKEYQDLVKNSMDKLLN